MFLSLRLSKSILIRRGIFGVFSRRLLAITKPFSRENDYRKKNPFELELISLIDNRAHKQIHSLLDQENASERSRMSSSGYLNVMGKLSRTNRPASTLIALRIYRLVSASEAEKSAFNGFGLMYYLLLTFRYCDDISQLLELKEIWYSNYDYNNGSMKLRFNFHNAFIHTFLNTGQIVKAVELFERCMELLNEDDGTIVCHKLPSERVLENLAYNHDYTKLTEVLQLIVTEESNKLMPSQKSMLTHDFWMKYLNLGLDGNSYILIQFIYDNFIMKGVDSSSSNDFLFNTDIPKLFKDKVLTNDTIYRLLVLLASHGDISLTLAIIESLYVNRTMLGEKALTKDLCVQIIAAYCTSTEEFNDVSDLETQHDNSVEQVLDVVGGFNQKFQSNHISYKDISPYLSIKFNRYNVYDDNINKVYSQRLESEKKMLESLEHQLDKSLLIKKHGNPNLEASQFGNVLANLNILTSFTSHHINYIKTQGYPTETFTCFINSLLNHVNLYQNFSGMVRLLVVLHQINDRMTTEWLNDELMDIILHSISNSNAKLSSLTLFCHLKKEGVVISPFQYSCFIASSLRGNFHQQLQYFIYEYLQSFGHINNKTYYHLSYVPQNVINLSGETYKLFEFLKALKDTLVSKEIVNQYWKDNNLQSTPPDITDDNLESFNRHYNYQIDKRDNEYLKYTFSI